MSSQKYSLENNFYFNAFFDNINRIFWVFFLVKLQNLGETLKNVAMSLDIIIISVPFNTMENKINFSVRSLRSEPMI